MKVHKFVIIALEMNSYGAIMRDWHEFLARNVEEFVENTKSITPWLTPVQILGG